MVIFILLVKALHVSGGFSAHHQELRNCTHSIGYCQAFLLPAASVGEFGEQYRSLTYSLNNFPLRRPSDEVLTTAHKRGTHVVSTNDGYINYLKRRIFHP